MTDNEQPELPLDEANNAVMPLEPPLPVTSDLREADDFQRHIGIMAGIMGFVGIANVPSVASSVLPPLNEIPLAVLNSDGFKVYVAAKAAFLVGFTAAWAYLLVIAQGLVRPSVVQIELARAKARQVSGPPGGWFGTIGTGLATYFLGKTHGSD